MTRPPEFLRQVSIMENRTMEKLIRDRLPVNSEAKSATAVIERYFNDTVRNLSAESEVVSAQWWQRIGHLPKAEGIMSVTLAYALNAMCCTVLRKVNASDARSARLLKAGLIGEIEKAMKPEQRDKASPWKV